MAPGIKHNQDSRPVEQEPERGHADQSCIRELFLRGALLGQEVTDGEAHQGRASLSAKSGERVGRGGRGGGLFRDANTSKNGVVSGGYPTFSLRRMKNNSNTEVQAGQRGMSPDREADTQRPQRGGVPSLKVNGATMEVYLNVNGTVGVFRTPPGRAKGEGGRP